MALLDLARSRDGERFVVDETFGTRLRRLREEANLSREQLAEKASVSLYTVTKLEQDQYSPAWTTVKALAKALGLTSSAFEDATEPTDEQKSQPRKRGRPKKTPAESPPEEPPPEPKRRKGK